MEAINTSGKEYERQYFPLGGFILIAKDMAASMHGKIIVPQSIRGDHSKWTSTGVVISKSLFDEFEDDREKYVFDKIKRGDRVGFGTTVPLYSPSPPFYEFEGEDKEKYVTLHVKDILCVICETEPKRIEFSERFK